MKRKFITVAAILAVISILFAAFSVVLFASGGIDYALIESFFGAAQGERGTVYYGLNDNLEYVEVYRAGDAASREWCPLREMGESVVNAALSAEDRDFFRHHGVNYKRTLAALLNHIFKIGSEFGGSTVTQQVVKNISGNNERTLRRKAEEILKARYLERNHSKEEILELYLNLLPMGNGCFGIKMAAERYFGKKPSELTVSEAATLIGITNAPSKYNPYTHPEECLAKRNRVLYAMRDNGKLTDYEYERAVSSPLGALEKPESTVQHSSWFIETVRSDAIRDISRVHGVSEGAAAMLLSGGVNVYTTMQTKIQEILEDEFTKASEKYLYDCPDASASMAICDSVTGELAAIVGNVGEKNGERLLNLAEVPVTPGSVLKPLALYAPLIDDGSLNWASVLSDEPLRYVKEGDTERPYPRNSPEGYDGDINLKDALRLSKNTVACRLYEMQGAERIYERLSGDYKIEGIVRDRKNVGGRVVTDMDMAPLALGQLSTGISVRKLAECFCAFPRDGEISNAVSYRKIVDSEGRVLALSERDSRRIMSPEGARIMNQLLSTVTADGTARSVTLDSLVDTAGKTGTSGGSLDKLFVGYTPYYTAAVWCGYPGAKRAVTGNGHLSLWDGVMNRIHRYALENSGEKILRSFSVEGLARIEYENVRGDTEYGFFKKSDLLGSL